jgi:uncharacterized membrane protein YcjF (UPF0283 family)
MRGATISLQSFPATLARAWTWGRRILWAAAAVFAVLIALEAIHLYELLAGVHPYLARVVAGLVGLAGIAWIGRSVWRYVRMPTVLSPPDLPALEKGWTEGQQRAYRDFAVRYLRRQERNPHLDAASKGRIPEAIRAVIAVLPAEVASDPVRAATELSARVDRELDRVLAPLDQRAKKLIRRAAVEVSLATAVSPSVLLDSLIALVRNVDLIAKLADLYYGRPGLRGTLRVLRDVLGSAVTAGALEVLTDNLSSALTEMTSSWSARLLGPLGQGTINGVVTMRLGAAARQRCRSLSTRRVLWLPWRMANYRRAASSLMSWLGEDVGPWVFGPLGKIAHWTGKATRTTVAGGSALLGVFRGRREGARADDSSSGPAPAGAKDPLFDGGILD